MTIQDAIKSGKPFIRPHLKGIPDFFDWVISIHNNLVWENTKEPIGDSLLVSDILAEDWEIKEEQCI
jgi:hypothetical protein